MAERRVAEQQLTAEEWRGVLEAVTLHATAMEPSSASTASDAAAGATEDAELPPKLRVAALENALSSAVATGALSDQERIIRSLNAATLMIPRCAVDTDTEILNPRRQFRAVLDALPLTLTEARELSADWRTRDIEEIRKLRSVKNLIRPASALADVLPPEYRDGRISAWEELLVSLP
jgi:hypothetical protein